MLKTNEMYCPHCGNLISKDTRFCKYCGAKNPYFLQAYKRNLQRHQHTNPKFHNYNANNTEPKNPLTNNLFILSLKRFLLNYFNFQGYSSSSDYWLMYIWFIIGIFLVNIICSLSTGSVGHKYDELAQAGYAVYAIFMFIPIISLSARHFLNTLHKYSRYKVLHVILFSLFILLDILFFISGINY